MNADPDWAWAPYSPSAERPWTRKLAGHLFRRAGFGASEPDIKRALEEGPARTVERLLRPKGPLEDSDRRFDSLSESAARAGSAQGVAAWWLRRMLETPHPLLEKMTLFWRGYFGVKNSRVRDPALIERHIRLLRRHALGRFDALLEEVSHDPAVLLTLDAGANRKSRPPELYARTLLEKYTAGAGNFSESDVRGIARAFSGWFVFSGGLRRIELEADPGPKRIFGREGPFDSREAVRIAVRERTTALHVVKKLYKFLVAEEAEPAEELLSPLAEKFAAEYDISSLVGTILRSNLFFSPIAYRRRVKSPVEYALGIARGLEGVPGTLPLAGALSRMGQDLCEPPTVEGWAGSRCWIDRHTLLLREKLAAALLSGSGGYGRKLDPLEVARRHGRESPEGALEFLLELFLDGEVDGAVRAELARALGALGSPEAERAKSLERVALRIFSLPEFHLA